MSTSPGTELAAVIRRGILTVEPRAGLTGPSGMFAGSYDWHSCVHAHWALASIGRLDALDAELELVHDRLTDPVLEMEREHLDQAEGFELPYGRAWFLLLLTELARTRSSATLSDVTARTHREIHGWLHASPFPEMHEPVTILATHRSWLFTLFLAAAAASPKERDRLRELVHERVDPQRERIAQHAHMDWDFIDVPSLVDVIDAVIEVRPIEGGREFTKPESDPEPDRGCGHACGRVAMCMWPDALLAASGDGAAAERYDRACMDIVGRRSYWCGSFIANAHWVPQFVWMAEWLRRGRP